MADLVSLVVADPPAVWRDLGFAVDGDQAVVGGVVHVLGAAGAGLVAWSVGGAGDLTVVPTAPPAVEGATAATRPHPNGVVALDHVVVTTPDLAATVAAFEHAGLRLRRTREAGTPDRPLRQAFFRLGAVIVEVVGPPAAGTPGPARLWGLAFTVADLDVTAARLGGALLPVRPAVQPGRRIATLDRSAGSSVPIAFMSAVE